MFGPEVFYPSHLNATLTFCLDQPAVPEKRGFFLEYDNELEGADATEETGTTK